MTGAAMGMRCKLGFVIYRETCFMGKYAVRALDYSL
jgi:hypothetical protein